VDTTAVTDRLLKSEEPSIRWKALVKVRGEDPVSPGARALQEEVRRSPRVQKLLAGRDASGQLHRGRGIYDKWQGAHWVLATLADIGYPTGDKSLTPLRDQVLELWLGEVFYAEFEADSKASVYKGHGVPVMEARFRAHASQQGNALYAVMTLGLDDGRCARLAERLLCWQWPDGGWNCDREPSADTSSFMETLTPLRGLALYSQQTGDAAAGRAARRAAEVFLERKLFRRRSDGGVIREEFAKLHYPLYWHYDILGGLKVLAEAGLVTDPRCADALELLAQKRLPDGGWPAEARYYKVTGRVELGADAVDWGGTSTRAMNEWVTADALHVLKAAGAV
jgi:hypothetical protein